MSIDLNAFNKFFIDYQQRFVHFACTYVHDEAVAEDFVVESMMYYWENKDRLSADTNIPAYVLTTIKHKCIDYLRHQQVYQDASDGNSPNLCMGIVGQNHDFGRFRAL